MKSAPLGRTDLRISLVGLGGLAFGGHYGEINKYECIRTIRAAVDSGVTFFDTSPSYGAGIAEEILGQALGSSMSDVVVGTKIGGGIDSAGRFWCLNNRANITRQVRESLRRLGCDSIPLYFIPGDDPVTPLAETMAVMEDLRAKGQIRFIGYCTGSADRLREAMKNGRIDVVMAPYNIINRAIEAHLIPFCRDTQVPLLACEPYCRGLLTGELQKASAFDVDDLRTTDRRFRGEQYKKNIEIVNRLHAFAEQESLSLLQLSLGWVLQNPVISAAVCGAKSRPHIRQSVASCSMDLTPERLLSIDQIVGGDAQQHAE